MSRVRGNSHARFLEGKAVVIPLTYSTEVEKLENTIKDYVEEDIKKKEILNILEKFLSDLKAGDRDIFVRRYWYMDNIKDIAKRHGCSETKIKSSLFRSRNRLWEEVKEII